MAHILDEAKIDEVRQATDIVAVISRYVPLKRSGKSFVARCPFHREKTPSFNVSPEKQIYKCFGCGEAGNVFGFLMKHERMSFPQAVRSLAEQAGIRIDEPDERSSRRATSRRRIREVNRWAARVFRSWFESSDGKEAREYLESRPITPATARKFGLGWAPDAWDALLERARTDGISDTDLLDAGLVLARESGGGYYDRFRSRLMFPIIDAGGEVIAFGGRALGEATPKYLNSPETGVFSKGRCVYGLNRAQRALREERRLFVVEGYTDVLALVQEGIENVVATLGTALTLDHLKLLRRYADEVTLVFDGDEPGQKAADRVLELFVQENIEVMVAHLPKGEDPCDVALGRGADAFREVVGAAVSALEFRLGRALAGAGGTSLTAKRRAIEEILRIIVRCDDEVKRVLLVQQTAAACGLTEDVLMRDVSRLRRGESPAFRTGPRDNWAAEIPGRERELLRALLADPAVTDTVVEQGPAPDEFEHPGARTLYTLASSYIERHGKFDGPTFVGTIGDPDVAKLAANLQDEIADSIDAKATLVSSLAAFERIRSERQAAESMRAIEESDDYDAQLQMLAEIAAKAREQPSTVTRELPDKIAGTSQA